MREWWYTALMSLSVLVYLFIGWLAGSIFYTFIGERRLRKSEIKRLKNYIKKTIGKEKNIFSQSQIKGRKWFADLYAESNTLVDNLVADSLEFKKRPALKAADEVKLVKKQKKEILTKLKFAEYQLKTYEEYFPIIEELKEHLLDDDSLFFNRSGKGELEEVDPAKRFLNPKEFKKLSVTKKNELALKRYMERNHSKLEIGRMYERYIGYIYEKDDWLVKFIGIIENFDDLGRDLICEKNGIIEIVQCKNWSQNSLIREKYLYQLFATTTHFKIQNKDRIKREKLKIIPVFTTTTNLSDTAKLVAKELKIRVDKKDLWKEYPMIKCNINPQTKDKIYHLPFDQQYDKIYIGNNEGEFYARSIAEAEAEGFRRAFRYRGPA